MSDDIWGSVLERADLIMRLAKSLQFHDTAYKLYIATSQMSLTELKEFVEWQETHD